jgi:hypothetical protein
MAGEWSGGQQGAFGAAMGLGILSAFMGANAASAKAAAQKLRFEEDELKRQMQNQIQNRNIAMDNAAKWMNNQRIAESANQARAEGDFWIKWNFDNASATHGQNTQQLASQLTASFTQRKINPRSGSAQALQRMTAKKSLEQMQDMRISKENKLVASQRKQQQALAGRDFGFNDQIAFTKGHYGGPSSKSAFNTALVSGLVSTAASGAGMAFGAMG